MNLWLALDVSPSMAFGTALRLKIDVGAGAGIINTNEAQFFSEGVTVDDDGNFYVGSMQHGSIHMAASTAAS